VATGSLPFTGFEVPASLLLAVIAVLGGTVLYRHAASRELLAAEASAAPQLHLTGYRLLLSALREPAEGRPRT